MGLAEQFVVVFHRTGWLFDFGCGLRDMRLFLVFREGVRREGDTFFIGTYGIPARAVGKQTGSHEVILAYGSILMRAVGGGSDGVEYLIVRGPGGEVHIPRGLVVDIRFDGHIDPAA